MVLERKVPPPPSGKKSTKVSNTFLDFKTQRFLTFFCHIFTFTKTTQQPLPNSYHKLRPGLVCVSRVKRLVKKKKKKKEKETDLRESRETTTTRKKRRGEERLRRLGF